MVNVAYYLAFTIFLFKLCFKTILVIGKLYYQLAKMVFKYNLRCGFKNLINFRLADPGKCHSPISWGTRLSVALTPTTKILG